MSEPRYNAFSFGITGYGPGPPGLRIAPSGGLAMVQGGSSVRQAVLLLLSTRPGERVMRPTYGCELHRLVFSPNDATTAGLAVHYVRQALRRWEPRIDVVRIDAGPDPARPELLNIVLDYEMRATRTSDRLTLALDLQGEPP
jgi:phage baseplate assembly protein W